MDSSAVIYYCCVCNGSEKLQSFNNGDSELESLAELCLQKAPSYHACYSHTMGKLTYAFLMEDGNTYFAIGSSSLCNTGVLRFLENVRDGFKNADSNGFRAELVPVIQQLIASLENVARTTSTEQTPGRTVSNDGSHSTNEPLLGKASSQNDRRRVKNCTRVSENHVDRGFKIDLPSESAHEFSLQKNSNVTRDESHSSWYRQVKFVVLIDLLLCVALFGVWLAVCNGFQCVSRG